MKFFDIIPKEKEKQIDVTKTLEQGQAYALVRHFMQPKDLDKMLNMGWELITFAADHPRYGYYFKKIDNNAKQPNHNERRNDKTWESKIGLPNLKKLSLFRKQ